MSVNAFHSIQTANIDKDKNRVYGKKYASKQQHRVFCSTKRYKTCKLDAQQVIDRVWSSNVGCVVEINVVMVR